MVFTLRITDDRTSAWMSANNWYRTKLDPGLLNTAFDEWYWSGALIQLGSSEILERDRTPPDFAHVIIHGRDRDVRWTREEFDEKRVWIDVWGHGRRTDRPVTDKQYQEITGARSLFPRFHPCNGAISLWTENGLDVRVSPTAVEWIRREDFTLDDEKVTVEIYETIDGRLHQHALENVGRIDVLHEDDVGRGTTMGPPA